MPSAPPPVQEIDEIVAITDPVLRNHRITDGYHRLALAVPVPRPDANWCAFAVWASRQAGETIRGEDLMRALERALGSDRELSAIASGMTRRLLRAALEHPGSRRARVLAVIGQEAFGRTADAVARGNRKVFGEIAREFARFVPLCQELPISPERLESFLSGVPLAEEGDAEDREMLRQAFRHLAAALVEPDRNRRAELTLLANLEIAYHEQARVQPEIVDALEAPYTSIRPLGRRVLEAIAPASPGWSPFLRTPLALLAGAGGRIAEAALRSLLRRLITESLMTLTLPGVVLRLGADLPGDPPECLREPSDPALQRMLQRLAPGAGDLNGVGAGDWSRLTDRMTLIGRYFHLHHENEALYGSPYTAAELAAIRAGRLP